VLTPDDVGGIPQAEPGPDTESPAYHFPVRIDVIGELDDHHLNQISQHVFSQLDQALRARG
jgi:hypothetical protein